MIPQWIIEKKRDGGRLTGAEIAAFVRGYGSGRFPDYQMAALAMAVFFRGMDRRETAALTLAMLRSGTVLAPSVFNRPAADKHSTGGIGDKVSIVLAPLAAACGLAVPMISGRGLGITGGTLDKMNSIPGYRTDLSSAEFVRTVNDCGCSIVGQTETIAPVDRRLYALRDVTGTVPSVPLIVSSILSKKLAEGLRTLVMDVKCGRGAFMKDPAAARELAGELAAVGGKLGLRVRAVVSAMDQPLGRSVGNALEIAEAIAALRGRGPDDLMKITETLTVLMVAGAGVAPDEAAARRLVRRRLASGAALETLAAMIRRHGGDPRVTEKPGLLPAAAFTHDVKAPRAGVVAGVDAELVGRACLLLGGGRTRTGDDVDPAVGVSRLRKIGERVAAGDLLAVVHANSTARLRQASKLVLSAFSMDEAAEPLNPVIEVLADPLPAGTGGQGGTGTRSG